MELYPDHIYSKPEFTALPPYLFSRADFALIPSRDELFGLVAVRFGRKGALGAGSYPAVQWDSRVFNQTVIISFYSRTC